MTSTAPAVSGVQMIDPMVVFAHAGMREGMAAADLGCGAAAHFVFPASEVVGKKGVVYAVDIQKPILKNIEQRARETNRENIITVWTDLEVYGATKAIKDASLDIAMLLNTLFQAKDKQTMMREAVRMTKQGGTLVVVEWALGNAPLGPAVSLRVPQESVRALAEGLGLRERDAFQAGSYHWGLVFTKP